MNVDEVRDAFLDFFCVREEWRFTRVAERDGYRMGFNQLAMVDLIAELLRTRHPLREVQLGLPPGSGGIGHEMRTSGPRSLYIKIKLEWNYALIMSFKENHEI